MYVYTTLTTAWETHDADFYSCMWVGGQMGSRFAPRMGKSLCDDFPGRRRWVARKRSGDFFRSCGGKLAKLGGGD